MTEHIHPLEYGDMTPKDQAAFDGAMIWLYVARRLVESGNLFEEIGDFANRDAALADLEKLFGFLSSKQMLRDVVLAGLQAADMDYLIEMRNAILERDPSWIATVEHVERGHGHHS